MNKRTIKLYFVKRRRVVKYTRINSQFNISEMAHLWVQKLNEITTFLQLSIRKVIWYGVLVVVWETTIEGWYKVTNSILIYFIYFVCEIVVMSSYNSEGFNFIRANRFALNITQEITTTLIIVERWMCRNYKKIIFNFYHLNLASFCYTIFFYYLFFDFFNITVGTPFADDTWTLH